MSTLAEDEMPVQKIEQAIDSMQSAKQNNLYDHRKVRMGLAKNIRLHEQAIEDIGEVRQDIREAHQQRDEDGRKVFRDASGRRVYETHDGKYVYEGGEPYIKADDHKEQVKMGDHSMSVADFKERTIGIVWEDVKDFQEAMQEVNQRELEVPIHVVDGELAEAAMNPTANGNEENFLHIFHDYREIMEDLEIPDGFSRVGDKTIERVRERSNDTE